MKKSTQELLKLLDSAGNIETFLETEASSMTVPSLQELLQYFLEQKQMKKSRCIADACLHREYGYQIFSGIRLPARDKIVSLCLALRLSREESDILLRAGGYNNLYSRNRRDSILIFALTKTLSVIDTNLLLDQMGEPLL